MGINRKFPGGPSMGAAVGRTSIPIEKKSYEKYCKKCALAKYNLISEINSLFNMRGGVMISDLTELRKTLELIDNEAASIGFAEMQKEELISKVVDS